MLAEVTLHGLSPRSGCALHMDRDPRARPPRRPPAAPFVTPAAPVRPGCRSSGSRPTCAGSGRRRCDPRPARRHALAAHGDRRGVRRRAARRLPSARVATELDRITDALERESERLRTEAELGRAGVASRPVGPGQRAGVAEVGDRATGLEALALELRDRPLRPALGTTPPVRAGLGVEHRRASGRRSRPSRWRAATCPRAPAARRPARRTARPPDVACGAGSWATGRGRTSRARPASRARRGSRPPTPRRPSRTARSSPPAAATSARDAATPGRQTSSASTSYAGRAAASTPVASPTPGPDLDDQRRLPAEPRRRAGSPARRPPRRGSPRPRGGRPTPPAGSGVKRLPRRE